MRNVWFVLCLQGTSSVVPSSTHAEAIKRLLVIGDIEQSEIRSIGSKQNFCNSVYKIESAYVAKVYSASAKARCPVSERGYWDEKAGEVGLGPRVIAKTEDALLLEYVEGIAPSADFLTTKYADHAARRLAEMHALSFSGPHASARPLWRSIETALSKTKDSVTKAATELSADDLRSRAAHLRSTVIDCLGEPRVLAHGDCKFSNLLLLEEKDDVLFLDFEMSGPNYAEYDLAKLCRQCADDCDLFIEAYNYYTQRITNLQTVHQSTEIQRLAISLLATVSWFEAACFFLLMASPSTQDDTKSGDSDAWLQLARDRFTAFLVAESAFTDSDLVTLRRYYPKIKVEQEQRRRR